jgi:hypothetical protein
MADITPVPAVPIVVLLVARVVRWRKPLGLGLSPEGVYHWSWFGCRFFPWDAITAVRAIERRGPTVELVVSGDDDRERDPADSWLVVLSSFRKSMRYVNAGYLAVDPALAYHGLRFYHEHPDHRHELATDAGIERLRHADFPHLRDKGWNLGAMPPSTPRRTARET